MLNLFVTTLDVRTMSLINSCHQYKLEMRGTESVHVCIHCLSGVTSIFYTWFVSFIHKNNLIKAGEMVSMFKVLLSIPEYDSNSSGQHFWLHEKLSSSKTMNRSMRSKRQYILNCVNVCLAMGMPMICSNHNMCMHLQNQFYCSACVHNFALFLGLCRSWWH